MTFPFLVTRFHAPLGVQEKIILEENPFIGPGSISENTAKSSRSLMIDLLEPPSN